MFGEMIQRGAWWKGITSTGVEVAVSDNYMKKLMVEAVKRRVEDQVDLLDPETWAKWGTRYQGQVTLFEKRVGGRPYTKVMLGPIYSPQHSFGDDSPDYHTYGLLGYCQGRIGTIILRTLSEKQLSQWHRYWDMLGAMKGEVDSFFASQGMTVQWP